LNRGLDIMPTYFLNASGSNTAPYDTPARGATDYWATIRPLLGAALDIVEVVDDGELDVSQVGDVANYPNTTIRSYGRPDGGGKHPRDPDRWANKPTIKVSGPGNTVGFYSQTNDAARRNRIQNIRAYIDVAEYNPADFPTPLGVGYGIIEGCEVWVVNRANGDGIVDSSIYCATNSIVRNCISVDSYYGVDITNGVGEDAQFYNNTIVMPDMDGAGGDPALGIWVARGAGFIALNNIVYGRNAARPNQIGIQVAAAGAHTQNYNDVYSVNTLYTNTVRGANGIEVDPLFEELSARNLRLRHLSPCKNVGANRTVDGDIPRIDVDGIARPQGTGFDIGAYEMLAFVSGCSAMGLHIPGMGIA
jgi:hypothetical protein